MNSVRPSVIAVILAAALLVLGCGAAKPRFSSEVQPRVRGAAERAHDHAGERVVAGTRDFRHERNVPLSPLEQSRLMSEISKYMGVPYELGGESGRGFDCSGYTRCVFRNALSMELPRTSAEQFQRGRPVEFHDLKFGDLVFFNTTGESASHVGIYLGDGLFAHAAEMLGVSISSVESPYYKQRYEGARRIIGE
jgi:hypothetical protein